MLKNKEIILGVTGSIAAYKAALIVRELKKKGAEVTVIMTEAATRFVTPLTFRTLSGNPVYSSLFPQEGEAWDMAHIPLAKRADLLLLAPATANIIGKIAGGIADELLTATVMATQAPVVIAPAMNTAMYVNSILQNNLKKLKKHGYLFVEPGQGFLACEEEGKGRLAAVETILQTVEKTLQKKGK